MLKCRPKNGGISKTFGSVSAFRVGRRLSGSCCGVDSRKTVRKTLKAMRHAEPRPFADPEQAARRIIEIASTVEPVQDGRIYIELINGPFIFKDKGSPAEYGAGMKLALERGWLVIHESGTFVKFTQVGAELFA